MTGLSVLQLVRNRAGFSWRRTRHRIKVRLVGLDFMELRNAPIELRAVSEFYASPFGRCCRASTSGCNRRL